MKALQDNFTTPEQSKRLLELGVPKWTADCYHGWFPEGVQVKPSPFADPSNPCWSVGRLIEIYELCYAQEFIRNVGMCLMEDVLSAIYDAVNDTTGQWDFSKLED